MLTLSSCSIKKTTFNVNEQATLNSDPSCTRSLRTVDQSPVYMLRWNCTSFWSYPGDQQKSVSDTKLLKECRLHDCTVLTLERYVTITLQLSAKNARKPQMSLMLGNIKWKSTPNPNAKVLLYIFWLWKFNPVGPLTCVSLFFFSLQFRPCLHICFTLAFVYVKNVNINNACRASSVSFFHAVMYGRETKEAYIVTQNNQADFHVVRLTNMLII